MSLLIDQAGPKQQSVDGQRDVIAGIIGGVSGGVVAGIGSFVGFPPVHLALIAATVALVVCGLADITWLSARDKPR
ncbi:MAG: hypothetical protein C4B59_08810 [Candidatus Methanogaster sp.]|uniref:Uncharacterized protein n=1 Tax=Candidatus Methanogaster sp. TaxID=3386292 RepID=A0AC61L2J5_9EURY|nr:MAG: hypothetical protein C4B59_08810 [ANME-2 cluster archaeon]